LAREEGELKKPTQEEGWEGGYLFLQHLSTRHQYYTVLCCLHLINQSLDLTTGGATHRYRCVIEPLDKKYNGGAIKQARKGCLWDAPHEMMHGAIVDAKESWKSVSAARFLIKFPAR
jgi:hypothetical protein